MNKRFTKLIAAALMLLALGTLPVRVWATDTWTRVTSVQTLLDGGTFIIGYEATANSGVIVPMANRGSATTSAAGYMYSGSTASNGGIGTINMSTVSTTTDFEVVIGASSKVNGAIYIKIGDYYLGNTNTKNNCKLFENEATTTSFTPTVGSNDNFTLDIAANTSGSAYRYLKYNESNPRFAVYSTTPEKIVIYKKVSGGGGSNDPVITITQPTVGGTVSVSNNGSNVNTGSHIAAGTTLTLGNTPDPAYIFSSYSVFKTGDATNTVTVTNGTFDMPNYDVTVTGEFTPKQTYNITVTTPTGGTIVAPTSAYEGQTVTISASPSDNYKFGFWTITGATVADADKAKTTFVMGSSNVNIEASFVPFDGFVNELTGTNVYAQMPSSGTGYKNWTLTLNSTVNNISYGATYNGNSNYTNNYIQLRNQSPSGVVSTTSGGKVRKVKVTWDEGNTNNRYIVVFGKNTAYMDPANLYNNEIKGDTIGILTYYDTDAETELLITDNYRYIGILASAAVYLDDIRINWEIVPKYAITIDNNIQHGSVVSSVSLAEADSIVTLTATPAEHYHLDYWYILDGGLNEVTTTPDATNPNKATFVMPASTVEVSATFAEDTKYTITNSDENHILVAENSYANETVEIQITDIPEGKIIDEVTVKQTNGSTEYDVTYVGQEENYYNYSFTMPENAVTVSVTFRDLDVYTVSYHVNGVETSTEDVTEGNSANLPTSPTGVPSGFTFVGWSTSEASTTTISSYTPEANAILYAVFSIAHPVTYTFTIYPSAFTSNNGYSVNDGNHTVTATAASSGESMTVTYTTSNVMQNNTSGTLTIQWKQNPKGELYCTISDAEITEVEVNETTNNYLTTTIGTNHSNESDAGSFSINNNGGGTGKASEVTVTFTKNSATYYTRVFTKEIAKDTWHFIASPVGTAPVNMSDLTDLYFYDEAAHYWRNKEVSANADGFDFALGKGYLAAYHVEENPEDQITLTFAGTSVCTDDSKAVDVTYNGTIGEETNPLAGWNLVGNPYPQDAYLGQSYYTPLYNTQTNKWVVSAVEASEAVAVCAGAMVQVLSEGSIDFSKTPIITATNGSLQMTIGQQVMNRDGVSSTAIDNAIVSFNEGNELPKFYFMEQNASLYIPQGNKEYAIATSEGQGEMPLNFRANADGQYTLTVNPEGVEMNYLHLIDNMTGNDIDLLQTPSYSFNAKTTDYESRFRLVFAANNESSVSASSTTFAFYSNGNWMVNNEGEASLQVIDVMGRVLSNQTISGTAELSLNQQPGVYVLRLVNGNDVKTQKIVVR